MNTDNCPACRAKAEVDAELIARVGRRDFERMRAEQAEERARAAGDDCAKCRAKRAMMREVASGMSDAAYQRYLAEQRASEHQRDHA